jgi:hypothetical protein
MYPKKTGDVLDGQPCPDPTRHLFGKETRLMLAREAQPADKDDHQNQSERQAKQSRQPDFIRET